jgi:DNA-binding transcriptional LysR family regulator
LKFDATLKDIALFVAVFEERSFTRAALRENATQSGVSQHIRKLEASHGLSLFNRDGGVITPTPAAETYYRRCIELLRGVETANREVREFRDGLSGEVAVGLMATVTRSALAPTLIDFSARHPNVRITVIEGHSRLLAQQVEAGEMDFAIVPTQLEHPGLKASFFLRTPEVLVSAKGSGLGHLDTVVLKDLGALKLILPSRHNIRRAAFERYFSAAGVQVARQMDLDVMFTTLDIVQGTDWRTLLPAIMMSAEIAQARLTINTLISPELWLDFDCVEPLRRPLSQAAQAFYEALRGTAESLNAQVLQQLRIAAPKRQAAKRKAIKKSTGRQQVK